MEATLPATGEERAIERIRREEPSEADLIHRAQEGDPGSFERLYRDHVGRVHALCRRLVGRPSDAEEMTQEVFARAWERLDRFADQSHFGAWLHTVAANLARNEWRTRARRGAPAEVNENTGAEPPSPALPVAGVRTDLERAIAELPAGARLVLLLHDVHGYRHEEIARINGSAVGTSKAQLHRARRMLRKALQR